MVTTGRTLSNGEAVPGTGFEFDPGGRLAELLAERTGPLTSHPRRPVWGAPLPAPERIDRTLTVVGAGYRGPPEHYHVESEESFEVLEGRLLFEVDGEERILEEGESVVVEPGTPHKFSNPSDSASSCLMEAEPVGKIAYVVLTLFGLAHEGNLTADGAPTPLQGAVITNELSDDTVFTSPPPAIQRATAKTLAPIGKLLGYRVAYPKYESDTFWQKHVEQPDL